MVIACKILNGFVVKNVSLTISLTAYFFIVCFFMDLITLIIYLVELVAPLLNIMTVSFSSKPTL